MKHAGLLLGSVLLLSLSACGKNGEITTFTEQNDPAPNLSEGNTIEAPEEQECPSCNLPDCCDCGCSCSDDGTTTVACDCEDEDQETILFFYDYLTDHNITPLLLPSLYEIDEDNYNKPMPTKACITINDENSHWWLISQISGSLFSNTNLRVDDFITEERNNTIYTYTSMIVPGRQDIVVEMETVTSRPEVVGDVFTFDPYNFRIQYHNLNYIDPVLGNISVTGTVVCEGINRHDISSDWWHTERICATSENVTVKFYNEPYLIEFRAHIVRDGEQFSPEDLSINWAAFTIDGEDYNVGRFVPDEVLKCLD